TAAQRKIISLLLEIKEEQRRQWVVLKDLQARVQGQTWEEEVEALDIDLPVRTMEQLDETERHLEDAGAQKRMVVSNKAWRRYQETGQYTRRRGGGRSRASSRTTTSVFVQGGTGGALPESFKMTSSRPQMCMCLHKRLETDSMRMVFHLSRMGGATVDDAVRRLMRAVLSFAVGSELNWVGRGQKRSFRNTRLQGVLFRALKRTAVGKEATHHQFADVVKKWLRFAPFRQGGSGRRHHYKPPVEFMCPKYPDTEGSSQYHNVQPHIST
ncbi:hypothetical protein NFI96_021622, partial [Prochilodus magdalenae]